MSAFPGVSSYQSSSLGSKFVVIGVVCCQEMRRNALFHKVLPVLTKYFNETIARWKLPDGIELHPECIAPPSDTQYASLRKNGISTAIFVDKGIAYISPGGGYMSTGHSQEIVLYCQRVHNTLKLNELYVRDNITSLVRQIEEITGKSVSRRLRFKLIEIDNVLYVAEMQSNIALFKVEFQ